MIRRRLHFPRRTRAPRPGVWLTAGLGCLAAGAALALTVSVEAGLALVVLGAGSLGAAAALASSSPSANRVLLAEIERYMADGREAERRAIAERWRREGVSPTEQAYHALLRSRAGAETGAEALDDRERRLGEMIQARCDTVWEGIRDRRYVRQEHGKISGLNGGAIFAEVQEIAQEVATLYNPGAANAVLEARTGDVALAARSAIGELLQVAQQVPFIDPAGWPVRKVVERLEQAQKWRRRYLKLTPYQHYVTGVTMAARLALGANPVALVAWFLAGEAAKHVGGRVVLTWGEAWLRELLEGSVALVHVQVARTCDPGRTYRSADWAALVEALRIHNRIPGIDHNRRLLLRSILRAQIPDEFAKLTLLRALAEDKAPDPGGAPPIDLAQLRSEQKQAIAKRLGELLPKLRGLNEPAASKAIEDLEQCLGQGLQVELIAGGGRAEIQAAEGFTQLALLAHDWLRLDRAAAGKAIGASRFFTAAGKLLGDEAAARKLLNKASDAADADTAAGDRRLVEPPRDLVGAALAEPLVTTLVDLLAEHTPARAGWPIEHDHMVLLNASVLLADEKQVAKVWRRYLEAASKRLEGLLKRPPSAWQPAAAPAILRQIALRDGGHPGVQVAQPAQAARPLAVFEATTAGGRPRWLLLFADAAVVGQPPEHETAIDDGEPQTCPLDKKAFTRAKGRMKDDLVVHCDGERLTVAGSMPIVGNTFQKRFGPVLEQLGLSADALPAEP